MRPGLALYIRRFAPFSARPRAYRVVEISHFVSGRVPVLVPAIFFAVVLAAQAQESTEEVALPPWSEPSLPSAEPASSTQTAPLSSAPEPLPSTPAEPLPSSTALLPSSEEAFPSSANPWSSSTNYTTAQTSVVPAQPAGGPYGGFSTKNVTTGEGQSSCEPRRSHYALQLT